MRLPHTKHQNRSNNWDDRKIEMERKGGIHQLNSKEEGSLPFLLGRTAPRR